MAEGSLAAPTREPIAWQDASFYDRGKLEAEMHRIFDICHGCRRCFNLCDSFPRLFDMIDESATGELDAVERTDYKRVVDACTFCDMCFMTKCPYVPPHEFNLDFPHLMLRYRAVELREGKADTTSRELTKTDRNGKFGSLVAPLANLASHRGNAVTRPIMEKVMGIDRDAALPKYYYKTFVDRALDVPPVNVDGPAYGRKAVLYATCFVNFNNPDIGMAARAILAHNGVETEVVYPGCCGMPQFEQGDIADIASKARHVAAALKTWIEQGYEVVALVPSCALMVKFEWPLMLPKDADIRLLADNTSDLSEYIVDIAKKEGMAPGMAPLPGDVTIQIACHARAQNMGQKGAEMLRLIPDTKIQVIERCSGHGGSWGVMKENFEIALKVGAPVAKQAVRNHPAFLSSECPLSMAHVAQGMERQDSDADMPIQEHPVQLLARAYGLL